ncbi:MAG: hypothetical protein H2052_17815, partial [Sphingosinicella sp.]|nr:hypothetical protein [Sphingosinicella sp.]
SVLPRVAVGAVVYIAAHVLLWKLAGSPDGFESKALEILNKALTRFRRPSAA